MSLNDQIIYASNVHNGGGKVLLMPILELLKNKKNVLFILDERLQVPDSLVLAGKIMRVPPTLTGRFLLEFRLWRLIREDTQVLCFGNLPPLWARSKNIVVFVQNRYLLESVPLRFFSPVVQMRIHFERYWLQTRAHRVASFIVQTKSMAQLMRLKLWRIADVFPYAVFSNEIKTKSVAVGKKKYDYIYVASDDPHKNHRRLIQAWQIMAKRGIYPSLCLTIGKDSDPNLYNWIDEIRQKYELKIDMLGTLGYSEVLALYHDSNALVYPSVFESLGLPLLEAAAAGLPIFASDLDYVRDIIKASALFNPYSSESIADTLMNSSSSSNAEIVIKLADEHAFLAYAVEKFNKP